MIDKYSQLFAPAFHRRFVWSLLASVGVHLALGGSYTFLLRKEVEEAIRRITFDRQPPPGFFVMPPSAVAKTMEFRKTPVPQGYFLQQKKETAQNRVQQVQALAALRTDAVLERMELNEVMPSAMRRDGSLGVRSDVGAVTAGSGGLGLPEPSLRAASVQGVKEARQQVDMQLDMLSVKNMDTGQYHAMVIQDPNNRRKIKGFLHIAQGYCLLHSDNYYESSYDVVFQHLDVLIKTLKEFTGIEADYLGALPLDDPKIQEIPWLLLSNLSAKDIGEEEVAGLGRYLAGGGFTVVNLPADSGSDAVLKRQTGIFDILRRAMKGQGLNEGADWRFVTLSGRHPIYHSFFDFDTSVRANQISPHSSMNPLPEDLGMEIGTRLAVFLNAGPPLAGGTGTLGEENDHDTKADATRSLQFALNTIVFALTQEGSVTQQLMTGVR
ncbi:MAG: DUF4159 domain-containing protein [Candidatus Latescibacteria bacterium]|nr:DUF4159 domain-containing protein [Candidatus Latescibacterota bacterium]